LLLLLLRGGGGNCGWRRGDERVGARVDAAAVVDVDATLMSSCGSNTIQQEKRKETTESRDEAIFLDFSTLLTLLENLSKNKKKKNAKKRKRKRKRKSIPANNFQSMTMQLNLEYSNCLFRSMSFVIGVDVGTTSARAVAFDATNGAILAHDTHEFACVHSSDGVRVESDADSIWSAVCAAVRGTVRRCHGNLVAIAFDAACSTVVDERLVIAWCDHRASAESRDISKCGASNDDVASVLAAVGGVMNLEMASPKLLWLKRHEPALFQRSRQFFDLSDFLAFRATNSLVRSQCTVTCKWTHPWRAGYFCAVGLEELAADDFARIGGSDVANMGTVQGRVSRDASTQLGVPADTLVGVGAIDAHAGALALFACAPNIDSVRAGTTAALILGTSACMMVLSETKRPVRGIWGPYRGAVLPGLWLLEAGQSACGALLDNLISRHADGARVQALAAERSCSVFDVLESMLNDTPVDTTHLHCYPDINGNRSPLADADAKLAWVGIDLGTTLPALYVAALEGLALQVRHILLELRAQGDFRVDTLACGGSIAGNTRFMRILSRATKCVIVRAPATPMMPLGSAILAATAAGSTIPIDAAMETLRRSARIETIDERHDAKSMQYFDQKYVCFDSLMQTEKKCRQTMAVLSLND
jgi:D-ribulokinase